MEGHQAPGALLGAGDASVGRTDEAPGLLPVAGERGIYDIIGHEEIVREHTPQERDGAPLNRAGGQAQARSITGAGREHALGLCGSEEAESARALRPSAGVDVPEDGR